MGLMHLWSKPELDGLYEYDCTTASSASTRENLITEKGIWKVLIQVAIPINSSFSEENPVGRAQLPFYKFHPRPWGKIGTLLEFSLIFKGHYKVCPGRHITSSSQRYRATGHSQGTGVIISS